MSFLDDYCEATRRSECPPSFHKWCGIFCISAALGRRVFTDLSFFNYFPNFYIILVAAAGSMRKSTAIEQAEKMIYSLQPVPNLVSQKLTPEALIDALRVQARDLKGNIILEERNEGVALCDELKNFINPTTLDAGLDTLLTSLYDCKDNWSYHTKSGGKQPLKNSFLTLLGGSTLDLLKRAIPESAIGSGVTRRMIFVYEDERTAGEPLPLKNKDCWESAKTKLQRIANLTGPMNFGTNQAELDEILDYYITSYHKWRDTSPLYQNPLTSSYADTHWTHVFKVAMCLAVNYTETLHISLEHLKEAERLVCSTERKLPQLMLLLTTNEAGSLMNWLETLIVGGVTDYKTLLKIMSTKVTRAELDCFLDTLAAGGRIKRVLEGNEYKYLPPT